MLKPALQAACRAKIEELARETADGGPALLIGTPWVEDGKLYNACCLLDRGAIAAVRMKVNLPNYGVFDERRVFAPGPPPGSRQLPRRAHRRADLRGHLDRMGRLRGRGRVPRRDRRRADRRAQRLAVLARQGRGSAQHRGRARHRERACRSSMSTRSAARTSWCSTAPRSGCMPIARSRSSSRPSRRSSTTLVWERTRQRLALRRRSRRDDRRGRQGGLSRLHAGAARLCRQERLQGRGVRAFRRRRLRPGGGAGGRCAGRRPRAVRDAAVSLHVAGIARRCGARRPGAAREVRCAADRARRARAREIACADLRGHAARRHRGKPAGARARHHPDGDLEQVRPDGGDDRQQVGNVGRLCHALRRHERRLQPDQGPLQDRGLSAVAAAQRLEARRRARPRRAGDPR